VQLCATKKYRPSHSLLNMSDLGRVLLWDGGDHRGH
jgi:hypothetical protein